MGADDDDGWDQLTSCPLITNHGGACERFGDYNGVNYANLSYQAGSNQFTSKKFIRPHNRISNSTDHFLGTHVSPPLLEFALVA